MVLTVLECVAATGLWIWFTATAFIDVAPNHQPYRIIRAIDGIRRRAGLKSLEAWRAVAITAVVGIAPISLALGLRNPINTAEEVIIRATLIIIVTWTTWLILILGWAKTSGRLQRERHTA